MKILLIRDIDKSRITAKDLANNGLEVIIEPVFLIKKLKFNINKFEKNLINTKNKSNLKDFKIAIANHNFGIIITSCNSCEAIIQGGVPLKTKIFSLSKKIANYLENKGFSNILIAREENALSLKNLILEEDKSLVVKTEACGLDVHPITITMNEFMRRMHDMEALGGKSMFGNMPMMHDVVINTAHPLIKKIMEMPEENQTESWKYLVDVAKLSQGMLRGKELNQFIQHALNKL